jgi:hypothetical protein
VLFALFRLLAFSVVRANQNYYEIADFVLRNIRQIQITFTGFLSFLITGHSHAVLNLVQSVLKHRTKFSGEHVIFGVEVGVR